MQLQIESPHFEPGSKLERLIESKFHHLENIYDRIGHCDVVLRKEKSDQNKPYSIEAKMEVPGNLLFASEREHSPELALRKLMKDIEHQLTRYKEELANW